MLKDLYRQANEDIKGDRVILEKAFEMAAKPEKKKLPILKYSYIGTAVAAVVVIGAVFVNSSIFTSKVEIIKPETENATEASVTVAGNIEEETEVMFFDFSDEAENENTTGLYNTASVTPVGRDEAEKAIGTQSEAASKNSVAEQIAEKSDDVTDEETAEDGIAVAFMAEEENDGVEAVEEETGEVIATWSLNRTTHEDWEEDAIADDSDWESDDEILFEEETDAKKSAGGGSGGNANNVPQFSYMYDLSCDYYAKTEGFVNVEVSPVTNSEEAIARAKRELNEYIVTSVSYDHVERMWRVEFQKYGPDGYDYIYVYLNSDGITQMIVYPGYNFG